MWKALLLVAALLVSGCASEDKPSDSGDTAQQAAAAPFLAPPTPLRFASGNFEGNLSGEATYSIAEQCSFECGGGGQEIFDLSSIVPANAPVELTVDVHGANAMLEFVDASAIGGEAEEGNGRGTSFAAIVIRSESGSVLLHVYNPGGFGIPPEPAPTASFDARGVVRADRLVANIPVAIKMLPGQSINLTDVDVQEAMFISPDGSLVRTTGPFTFTANATAGLYVVMMIGAGSTAVTGPDVPMVARRLNVIEGETKDLASGTPATWSFTPESPPVQVGVRLAQAASPVLPFSFGSVVTSYEAKVTNPGNVAVISEGEMCTPVCQGGFGFGFEFETELFDERLLPGVYGVSVSFTGNGMQATPWHMVIAA